MCRALAAPSAASLTRLLQVGADHARRGRGEALEVDVVGQRHRARVDLEDLLAPLDVGRVDGHAAVEAAGAQQRGVQDVGAVGRGQDDDALRAGEAVHLGEDLVQRLLALVVPAERRAAAALAADRVELVDEDDRGRRGLGLREQVAHARRAHADDHLDELARADREERDVGLARDRARQQRLAGAGLAAEQHALGDHRAERAVLVRVLEEVDDLLELVLGLVDARDVGERRARARVRLVALGARAAQAAEPAAPRRPPRAWR